MSEIRNFSRADAAAVAALFQKTFRNSATPPPASLEAYLEEGYLDHPWYDSEIASRVHVNGEGRVTGFVGVFPGRFEYQGKVLRAAIAGSLMVEHPEREPLAGAKLLRSVIKGPQDISISETTNLVSQALWERLGGSVITILSLDWFRVMRPASAALSMLAEKLPRAAFLAPAARVGDRIGRPWTRRYLRPTEPAGRLRIDTQLSDAGFAAAVLELSRLAELRPAWSEKDLEWLLAHAARKERYGPVHRTVVRNGKGELVGCYIYHGRPGGIGRVLQVLARAKEVENVTDCLLHEADRDGLSGLRGRCTPQLMNALFARDCFFVHRASTAIHTANDELSHAIEAGKALITGLGGESWTRLVGDEFA